MPTRFAHTNLVARDWRKLADFYINVFDCELVPPQRDQQGPWLEAATGVVRAHLRGAHLRLPGHGTGGPTLEVYEYAPTRDQSQPTPDRAGLGHLAFHVDDVDVAVAAVVGCGGARLGDIVAVDVDGVGSLRFAYVRDPEGNIIEVQRWS